MRIIFDKPTLYDEIDAAFGIKGQPVICAWGHVMYVTVGRVVPSNALIAHEMVHGERQLTYPGGIEAWWRRYIAEPEFRLAEEIPAHRAELAVLATKAKGPSMKAHVLSRTAARLAAPLYGNLVTIAEAKRLLAA